MTIVKSHKIIRTIGNKQEIFTGKYYIVGGKELNDMLSKVNGGEDETMLREKLIKESKWGEK